MSTTKKILFQKTEKTGDESKKDLSQFTLPSTQEKPLTKEINSNQIFGSLSSYQSSELGSFWGSKKGWVWIAGFVVCIIGAVAISFIFYKEGSKKEIIKVIPTPIPIEAVQEAIPTPQEIDSTKYKIKVLNGSGISGEAAKVKALLEEEGLIVSSIGNADRNNYKESTIQIKKDIPEEYLGKLRDVLEKSYTLSLNTDLSETEDIIVIIGSEKVQ